MDIRSKVMHALRWSVAAKFASQVISWAITIIVIRILTPQDYGLMAMALLFINFTVMFSELGLGAAIVQMEKLDEKITRQVFSFILVANFGLFLLSLFAAPFVADFFDEQRLVLIIQILAIQFILMSFEMVPMALLERELHLKQKALAQLSGQVAGGITALALALSGFGVWALVGGTLADTVARVIGMNIARPFLKWPSFSLVGMKSVTSFGGIVTGERVLWFFYNQADIFIIGKLLGKTQLGIYSVAMHLSSLIMHKTGEVIYTVSFPAFARIQSDPQKVKEYYLKSVRLMSIFVFPMFIGMSAVAHELVEVLLGEKWSEAGLILQILCLIMPLRMISNLFPPLLQGLGRPDISLKNLIYAIVIMPMAFVLGVMWDLVGVSVAWLIAFPIVLSIMVYNTKRFIDVQFSEVLKQLFFPVIASALMFVTIYVGRILLAEVSSFIALPVYIFSGAALYTLLLYSFNRTGWEEVIDLIKRR
jgi:O-antigen/teichoic acid export membrane protein